MACNLQTPVGPWASCPSKLPLAQGLCCSTQGQGKLRGASWLSEYLFSHLACEAYSLGSRATTEGKGGTNALSLSEPRASMQCLPPLSPFQTCLVGVALADLANGARRSW